MLGRRSIRDQVPLCGARGECPRSAPRRCSTRASGRHRPSGVTARPGLGPAPEVSAGGEWREVSAGSAPGGLAPRASSRSGPMGDDYCVGRHARAAAGISARGKWLGRAREYF